MGVVQVLAIFGSLQAGDMHNEHGEDAPPGGDGAATTELSGESEGGEPGTAADPRTARTPAEPAVEGVGPDRRAQELFRQAQAAYGVAQYGAAIEYLTEAYRTSSEIEDEARRARILHVLQINLAQAHVEAWRLDGDLEHLRLARSLVGHYLARGGEGEAEDRALAQSIMVLADEQLAVARDDTSNPNPARVSASAGGAGGAGGAGEDSSAGAGEDSSQEQEDRDSGGRGSARPDASHTSGTASDRDRAMRPLRLSGVVSLGASALSLGVMGAGMGVSARAQKDFDGSDNVGEVEAARQRGSTGNVMAIVGGAAAGALAVTGVVLLVVDRRAQARSSATRSKRATLTAGVGPADWGTGAQVHIGGRF